MRNLLLLSIMMLGLWCCQKEDSITPDLKLENLYAVKDDASDTIQQRVYDIYEKYKVTVVFNDTIGKVFVKTDIDGDSVFTYETVDPAYSFTGYTDLDYEYTYLTDPTAKSQLLDVVEKYLGSCNKNLYPQVVLLTDGFTRTDKRGSAEIFSGGSYLVTYRSLLISYVSDEEVLATMPEEILMTFIEQRINDYSSDLLNFHRVSKDFIGKSYAALGIDALPEPVSYWEYDYYTWGFSPVTAYSFSELPFEGSVACLQDDWYGLGDFYFITDFNNFWGDFGWTAENVETFRDVARQLIGPFGFVADSEKDGSGMVPPIDQQDDLQVFMKETLRFSHDEFEALWGDYPLVMQKYEILYDLLTNEFGVEL